MKKNNNFFNIKNKLIIYLLLIIIVPSIFVVNYIGEQFSMYLESMLNYTTKYDMVRIDSLIDLYLNIFEENVDFLADNQLVRKSDNTIESYVNANDKVYMTPSKNGGIEQQIYNLFAQFGESNSSMKYVYMCMENGSFIQWPEGYISEKYDPRQRPWYKAAMQNPGKTVITDPYYYPSGDITVISIVKTIQNEQGETIGVQAIDLGLKEITDMVKNFKVGKTGYVILTDKTGIIIANPKNPGMNFKNIKVFNIEGFNDIEKTESAFFDAKLDGTEKFINIYTSENNNFKLISVIEEKELLEQVMDIKQNILVMVVICALTAIVLTVIFLNRFSRPIFIIKKHLNNISYGDFKKNIPEHMLKRKDEFGDLSIAIESMQNRLENLISEIKKSEEEVKENLNFLQVLIDTIPSPIFSKDVNGVYNHCNIEFSEFLGIDRNEIIGHNAYELCEKELADIYYKADIELMETKRTQKYEAKVIYKDGTKHDVIFNKAAILNYKGEIKGMVGVILDITKEKATQEKINKLLKLKEIMLQIGYFTNEMFNINDLFKFILDKVIDCFESGKYGTILVMDENNKLKIAVAKGYREEGIENFRLDLENTIVWINTEGHIDKTIIVNNIDQVKQINIIETEDGMKIKSLISAPIIVDDKLYGFINLDSNNYNAFGETEFELMEYIRNQLSVTITKHKLYEETIYLSKYDKLTNLYNRSYFEQLIYTDIYESIKMRKKMLVVVLDLNGLKFVNDNYGHLAGDKFIKTFAAEFKNCGAESDITARFGGDEFVGVIYNRSMESLANCLDNINEKFQDIPLIFGNHKFICSFSFGISSFPEDGDDFNNLIKIADERMYERKKMMKVKSIKH